VRDERIPESVKSPFSLKADYANPQLYGWAPVIVGILALVVGTTLVIPNVLSGDVQVLWGFLLFFLPIGLFLFGVGYWMVTRAE